MQPTNKTRLEVLAELLNVSKADFTTRGGIPVKNENADEFQLQKVSEDGYRFVVFYDVLCGEEEKDRRLRELVNEVYTESDKIELFGSDVYEDLDLDSVELTDYLNFEGEKDGYAIYSVIG